MKGCGTDSRAAYIHFLLLLQQITTNVMFKTIKKLSYSSGSQRPKRVLLIQNQGVGRAMIILEGLREKCIFNFFSYYKLIAFLGSLSLPPPSKSAASYFEISL
jgi:hypothetical protein